MTRSPEVGDTVLFHFRVYSIDDRVAGLVARPAMVTSIGSADDVLNLYVFFEPADNQDPYRPHAPHQLAVHPCGAAGPAANRWSWPSRRSTS